MLLKNDNIPDIFDPPFSTFPIKLPLSNLLILPSSLCVGKTVEEK